MSCLLFHVGVHCVAFSMTTSGRAGRQYVEPYPPCQPSQRDQGIRVEDGQINLFLAPTGDGLHTAGCTTAAIADIREEHAIRTARGMREWRMCTSALRLAFCLRKLPSGIVYQFIHTEKNKPGWFRNQSLSTRELLFRITMGPDHPQDKPSAGGSS